MSVSRLDEAIRSVPADSSSADSDQDNDQDLDIEDTPSQGYEDDDGDQPEDGESGKRTIENVRGEVLRKLDKTNKEMMRELQALREESKRMTEQFGVPSNAQPASNQPKTLDDMSVQELETMRANVPEDQAAAFEHYLQERKIDEKVNKHLNEFQQKTQRKTAEQRFNEQAIDRWPALRDTSTEFYRITDRILGEMGPIAADNPRAVLDAANEAGLELGLSPSTGVRSIKREPGSVAPGRRTAPGPGSRNDVPNLESMEEIASRLQNAMPGKKFTKDQLKRIAKRQKLYKDSINTRVRG